MSLNPSLSETYYKLIRVWRGGLLCDANDFQYLLASSSIRRMVVGGNCESHSESQSVIPSIGLFNSLTVEW